MIFTKFSVFTDNTILDPALYSGRYAILLNNSQIAVLDENLTDDIIIEVLSFDSVGTAAQLATYGNITFTEYTVDVVTLIDVAGSTLINLIPKYRLLNKLFTVGFETANTANFTKEFTKYVFDTKYAPEIETPQFTLTVNQLTGLNYYKDGETNQTFLSLTTLDNKGLIDGYKADMYAQLSFLGVNVDFWQTFTEAELDLIITKFSAFRDATKGQDVFNVSMTECYYDKPTQTERDTYIEKTNQDNFNTIIKGWAELKKEKVNMVLVNTGNTLFYKHFNNFKLKSI